MLLFVLENPSASSANDPYDEPFDLAAVRNDPSSEVTEVTQADLKRMEVQESGTYTVPDE